jgi:succinate dehydrogenase hydrophobic anchor subunit
MMRLTAFASAFLVLLLITLIALSSDNPLDATVRLFSITGTALFSALFIYLILQQRDRHRIARQTLY